MTPSSRAAATISPAMGAARFRHTVRFPPGRQKRLLPVPDFVGSEADEPGMGRRFGEFGRAGLTCDGNRRRIQDTARAGGHHTSHVVRDLVGESRREKLLRRMYARVGFIDDPSAFERVPAVRDRSRDPRHLEGRCNDLPLPVRCLWEKFLSFPGVFGCATAMPSFEAVS